MLLDPAQFNYLKVGENAVLTFSYMVSDGIAQVPQTLTVTVSGRNDAPVVAGAIVASSNEDGGTFSFDLLAGASDVDGDALKVSSLKLVSGQSVRFTQKNGVLSLDTNQFNALALGESQDLVFTYLVSDGHGGTVAQTATLTIEGRNDSPVLKVSSVAAGLKENVAGLTLAKVTATDPDGDPISFTVDDARFEVVGGLLRLKAGQSLDYEATPNGASVTVTATATDSLGASTSTVVGYKVIDVNEPLKAADDSVSIDEDQAVTIAILANDLHASNVRLPTITTASVSHGSVTINADGTLTYVPGANRDEPVVISYTLAEDGKVSSARVNVSIVAKADAPAISFAGASGDTYTSIALDVSAALVDLDGSETLSDIVIGGLPADARLSAGTRNDDGSWVLSQAQLAGLSVICPTGGVWSLTVTASSTEASNGDSATTVVAGTLNVVAVPTINADWLYGKSGYDLIYGQPGNDYIDGLGGNDEIFGEAGDDYIRGGDGNDYLRGGAGNDILDGGAGNDRLYGDAGTNTVYGGAGNDTIFGFNKSSGLMDGGDGDDVFTGFTAAATIFGGTGQDTVVIDASSRAGDSIKVLDFTTGPGGDVIDLNAFLPGFERIGWDGASNPFTTGFIRLVEADGNVTVQVNTAYSAGATPVWTSAVVLCGITAASLTGDNFGRLANFSPAGGVPVGVVVTSVAGDGATLWGSGGDDILINQGNFGYVVAGAGDDVVIGGTGNDWVSGGVGSDTLYGGAGNDTLYGGDGWDGGVAHDVLYGEDGNDRLALGSGDGTAFGGAGNDDIWLYTTTGHWNTVDAGSGDDVIRVEGMGANQITTGSGRDVITMGYYTSTSSDGGSMVTDFTAGLGGDKIDLSLVLSMASGWNSSINPFASGYARWRQVGNDAVLEMDRDGSGKTYGFVPVLTLQNVAVDSLSADNFVPAFDPTGAAATGISLTGGSGNDSLLGGAGADVLSGGYGNDALYGDAGSDLLSGGGPATTICRAVPATTCWTAAAATISFMAISAMIGCSAVTATTRLTAAPVLTICSAVTAMTICCRSTAKAPSWMVAMATM